MTDLSFSRPKGAVDVRLVRIQELLDLTGLSRSTAHRLMKNDPTFPKPVKLSNSTARNAPVAFVLGEVQAWIQGRIEAREEGR